MIVREKLRFQGLFRTAWKQLVLMSVYSSAFVVAYQQGNVEVAIPPSLATMLGTALSVMLAFKTNAAYDRWWEARKIWGAIVNDSRTFARQVLTLIVAPAEDQPEARKLQEELVHRQIGWSLALNRSLRGIPSLPELGKCERIKSTRFATPYAYIVSRAIRLFFLLLPAGLVQYLGWITVPVSILVAGFFVLIELVSTYLQDLFENRSSDTAMDAICRTIEINLRQQLGEGELPPKLEPIDGVLM